jgi:uncharacterized FAD-dependent dehydrogenase
VNAIETRYLIVGAGASGLLMAHELERLGETDFLVLDRGHDLNTRERLVTDPEVPEKTAARAVLYGIGGAGLFSDGKLNFSPRIGGNPLTVISERLHRELSDYTIRHFRLDVTRPDYGLKAALERSLFGDMTWELVPVPQAHIGSDHLPTFVRTLTGPFRDRLLDQHRVTTVDLADGEFVLEAGSQRFVSERLVIAVGQAGCSFAERVARRFDLTIDPAPADLGIRIETPIELWKPLVAMQWDPKVYWRVDAGEIRTFCTNPCGYVVGEYKKGFFSVNGHARRDTGSDYTNFALMIRIARERPNEFLASLCKRINEATDDHLLVQRVGDLLAGRATNTLGDWHPTCGRFVLGDIRSFYPREALDAYTAVLEGISRSFPAFVTSGSIIYAPEVKLYSNRIRVSRDSFESELPGLHFLGDSCGHIHGLANAMLSGLACARTVMRPRQDSMPAARSAA